LSLLEIELEEFQIAEPDQFQITESSSHRIRSWLPSHPLAAAVASARGADLSLT
jgi:hypothetical protein